MNRKFYCLNCGITILRKGSIQKNCPRCGSMNQVREDHPFSPVFNPEKVRDEVMLKKREEHSRLERDNRYFERHSKYH